MLEVKGRGLRARVHPDASCVKGLAVFGLNPEAVSVKGKSISDNVIRCFAVAFRFCCSPASLQILLGFLGRLRERENEAGAEDQQAYRQNQPVHNISPVFDGFNCILLLAIECSSRQRISWHRAKHYVRAGTHRRLAWCSSALWQTRRGIEPEPALVGKNEVEHVEQRAGDVVERNRTDAFPTQPVVLDEAQNRRLVRERVAHVVFLRPGRDHKHRQPWSVTAARPWSISPSSAQKVERC